MTPSNYASLFLACSRVPGNESLPFHSPQSEEWYDNVYVINTFRAVVGFCGFYLLHWVLTSCKKPRGDVRATRRRRGMNIQVDMAKMTLELC